MVALRIDGSAIAAERRQRTASGAAAFAAAAGRPPGLAVVLVGENPASQVYVRNKEKFALACGMRSFMHRLPATVTEENLLTVIRALNDDPAVDGILVQLPLPRAIRDRTILLAVDPAKDVDGFHPLNIGRLAISEPALVPCTPLGCLILAQSVLGDLGGLDAVVVGRSNIVGKPMAHLLTAANATVTLAHSATRDIASVCRRADLLVVATGQAEMVRGDWVKPGAVVIDVGINRLAPEQAGGTGRLVGDVCTAEAEQVARAITPVPGGVGPMTIACLLGNTLTAARLRAGMAPG